LKRHDRAPTASKPAVIQAEYGPALTFFVTLQGRRRRCAVTEEALEVLEGRELVTAEERARAFARHRAWLKALAAIEISERRGETCGTLLLTGPQVRFQLACEETDLPDILCF
jgi:hypothetical protein